MIKIDVKDRKMLYYLSKNSRESDSKIAELVGISKGDVLYKKNKLLREGIISKFSAVINTEALSFTSFAILLRFNKESKKEVLNFFINHQFSLWVATLSGTYDLFIEFVARDLTHIKELIKNLREHFGEELHSYKTYLDAETLKVEHLIEDFYSDLNLEKLQRKERTFKPKKLDLIDKKILKHLTLKSDDSLINIADAIGSKWDIVRYRIKQLEESGIILKYFPEVNIKKLGYADFLCNIQFANMNKTDFKKFKDYITNHKNTIYAFADVNSLSLICNCAFKSIDYLDDFLGELRNLFREKIISLDYYTIKDHPKFDLFPQGLLKD